MSEIIQIDSRRKTEADKWGYLSPSPKYPNLFCEMFRSLTHVSILYICNILVLFVVTFDSHQFFQRMLE